MQSEPEEERVGEVIGGKWTLERLIGVGGMAAVYAARHNVGTVAAIKVLHPQFARLTDLRLRFEREALVMGRLDHPGAVQVRDIDVTDDGAPYIVMELLEGRPLSQCMRDGSGVSVPEMLAYADQTLSVLEAAHRQGIVHRDIKPDNLFVTHEGQLKVLDFGIARMLETQGGPGQGMTAAGTRLGTLPYMPPEQVLGSTIDPRADLFALGAVMFKVMAGRRVHECRTETELLVKMARDPGPPLCEVAPHVPPSVGRVVDCALAVRRDDRYPDAQRMQADVQAVLDGRPPTWVRTPNRQPLSAADTAALTGHHRTAPLAGSNPASATRPTGAVRRGGVSATGPTAIPTGGSASATMATPRGSDEPTRIEGATSRSTPPPAPTKQKTDPMHVPPVPAVTAVSQPAMAPAYTPSAPLSPPLASPTPAFAPAAREGSSSAPVLWAVLAALTIGVVGVLGAWVFFAPEEEAQASGRRTERSTDDDDASGRYEPVDLDEDDAGLPGAKPQPPVAPSEPAPKLSKKERKKLEKERKKREKERKKLEKKRSKGDD